MSPRPPVTPSPVSRLPARVPLSSRRNLDRMRYTPYRASGLSTLGRLGRSAISHMVIKTVRVTFSIFS